MNAHLNALIKEERAAYAESKRLFEEEIRQLSERIKRHDASVADAQGRAGRREEEARMWRSSVNRIQQALQNAFGDSATQETYEGEREDEQALRLIARLDEKQREREEFKESMQREYETLKGNAQTLTSKAEALNRDNAELLAEVARLGQEAKAREKAGAALRVELEGVRRERNQLRDRSRAAEEAESKLR